MDGSIDGNLTNDERQLIDDEICDQQEVKTNQSDKKSGCYYWIKTKVTVEPFIFLYHVMYMGYFTMTQQYVLMRLGGSSDTDDNYGASTCDDSKNDTDHTQQLAQAKASYYLILLEIVMHVISFPVTIYLGSCLTHWGCKKIFLFAAIGTLIRAIIYTAVVYFNLDIRWFFLGNIIEGLCGGMATILMTWTSYLALISSSQSRSFRLTVGEFAVAMGLVIGSLVIGHLIKKTGYASSYAFMAVITILAIICLLLFLPDIKDTRECESLSTIFSKTFKLFFKKSSFRYGIWINVAVIICAIITESGMASVSILYALNTPFCMTSVMLGYLAAEIMLLNNFGMIVLVKFCRKSIGEIGILIIGFVSTFFRFFIFSIAGRVLLLFLGKCNFNFLWRVICHC